MLVPSVITQIWSWAVILRGERIRRDSPVGNKRGAEPYKRELRDILLDRAMGKKIKGERKPKACPTLAAFEPEFMRNYAKANNKASEVHTKDVMLRLHLLPAFGSKKLDAIGVREVEAYKAEKLQQEYKAKSINNQLGVLRKLLRTAHDWKMIDAVPQIRPLRAAKPEIRFLEFDEADRFIEAVEDGWRAMAIVALNTGLRQGELLALRWKQVDLKLG